MTLDLSLFDHILTAVTPDDRLSLLALQSAARATGPYSYLEIGSDLGGTLQPHVIDPLCQAIVSIDTRVASQPDERGRRYPFEGNSTERMREHLARIPGADLAKLTAFERDASEIERIEIEPAYCFIDAEHTDEAVLRDFRSCYRLTAGRAAVAFHDSWIVYRGLRRIVDSLTIPFQALHLPTSLFLIDLTGRFADAAQVQARALDGWRGYLDSLQSIGWYREQYLQHFPGETVSI